MPVALRITYVAVMLGAVFCSLQPQEHAFATTFTGFALLALAGLWAVQPSISLSGLSLSFGLFLAAVVVSLPVALYYGTTLFDWGLRGAAPLAFLSVFFFLPVRAEEDALF